MTSTRTRIAFALVLAAAPAPLGACSGSSGVAIEDAGPRSDAAGGSGGGSGAEAGSTSGGSEAGGGSSSSGSPPILSDDAGVDSICFTETRPGDCAACCSGNHPAGAMTYLSSVAKCVCASSACLSSCMTTYCATNQTAPVQGSLCGMCINTALGDGGSCVGPVNSACQGDPDCLAYRDGCVARCP